MPRTTRSDLFVVLLAISLAAAPIAGGTTVGESTPRGANATGSTTTDVGTEAIRDELNQSARIAPGGSESFVDGGVYTAVVTVDVGKQGWFDLPAVSEPQLELDLTGNGARIVSLASDGSDYDDVPENVGEDCAKGCTVSSTTPFSAPNETYASKHTVMVRFALNRSEPTEEVTLTADPTPGADNGDGASVTYEVAASADSATQLAQAAQAQARLSETYNRSYNEFFRIDWESKADRYMMKEFTIVINEAATSLVTAYLDEAVGVAAGLRANNLDTLQNAQSAYGMAKGSFGEATTVGKITRVNRRLYTTFENAMDVEPIESAGNTSYLLSELAALSRAEAEAWRNGDREEVLKNLHRKQYLLLGYSGNVGSNYPEQLGEHVDPEGVSEENVSPNLYAQSNNQRREAAIQERPTYVDYFDAVNAYAREEFDRIRGVSLPLARAPAPSVRLGSSRSELRDRLAKLSVGETTTVTVRASNGEDAGVTSTQGYLSVAHADTLNVTDVTQTAGDEDVFVEHTSAGEPVEYRNGSRAPATAPLTDIYEPYDPGENNTYRLTVERTGEAGSAWLTYRTAFEPLVHDDTEPASFERYPTAETVTSAGPQNWAAFNVSTAFETNATNDPPTARIDLSAETVTPNETVGVDGVNSTDPDGTVTNYEWTFGDGTTATGATAEHAYDASGTYTVSLTVTDDEGESDTTNRTVTVEAPKRPYFAIESVGTSGPVETGTPLNVSVRVGNTGEGGGEAATTVRLPGSASASKSPVLAPGRDTSIFFQFPTGTLDPGNHTVTIATPNETTDANVTVEHARPPTFDVSVVDTKGDPPGAGEHDVFAGTPLRVVAEITNTDDYAGEQNVTLSAKDPNLIEPVLRNDTSVDLKPGETVERIISVPTEELYPGYANPYEATLSAERPDDPATVTGRIVPRTREFVVSLNDTNRPVEPGESFEATVHVTNDGYAPDTQGISLNLGGVGTATRTVELVGESQETVVLSVPTAAGTTGRYTAEIASANTSTSVRVNVFETPEKDIDSEQLSGSGTPSDPYVITNASALQAMEDNYTAYDPRAHYVLGSDIDASETAAWNGGKGFDPVGNPVGSGTGPFDGVFDGNGHTIRNLTIDRPTARGVGLFGYVGFGNEAVENVSLVGANITGAETVGGIAGLANAAVNNSSVSGDVVGGDDVGGLVGYLSYSGTVKRSFTRGTVDGAGLVGHVYGNDYVGRVTQSYSLADAETGLVGTNAGRVTDSYAAGNASDGLVGTNAGARNTGKSADLYWDTSTVEAGGANGTGLTSARMTGVAARSNMTTLDFGDVWTVRPGGYPALAWESVATNGTPDIAYRNLTHNRSDPRPGDPLAVTATVVNRGTATGTFNASLSANDTVFGQQNGTLAPGERRTLRFVERVESAGRYDLRVGGPNGTTPTRSVRVVPPHADLGFGPANGSIAPAEPLTVNVTADLGEASVTDATVVVDYDADVLNATDVGAGDVLGNETSHREINPERGTVTLAVSRPNATDGVSGSGTLATLTFELARDAQRNATAALSVADATALTTANGTALPYNATGGSVTVAEPWPEVSVAASLVDPVLNAGATTTLTARASANRPVERVGYDWRNDASTRAFEESPMDTTVAFELAPGESTWNGSGYGTRTLTLTAAAGPRVVNTTLSAPVYLGGDATGDGEVDVFDAVVVGTAWNGNATTSPGRYTPGADLTGDGEVGIADAAVLGREWNSSAE